MREKPAGTRIVSEIKNFSLGESRHCQGNTPPPPEAASGVPVVLPYQVAPFRLHPLLFFFFLFFFVQRFELFGKGVDFVL